MARERNELMDDRIPAVLNERPPKSHIYAGGILFPNVFECKCNFESYEQPSCIYCMELPYYKPQKRISYCTTVQRPLLLS